MASRPDSEYNRKRNFDVTSEPPEDAPGRRRKGKGSALRFVIQKHDARRLHYDFRLELDGTLKSWAVPKGPSLDPKDKRLAVHVEDHPISYARFEGSIPKGQYGAGDVIVWDQGIWEPLSDPAKAYADGKLKFTLTGEKLSGDWTLVRTRLKASGDKEQWLLIKERDGEAMPSAEYDIVEERPESVISGKTVGKTAAKKAVATKTAASRTRQAKSPSKPAAPGNLHTAIPEQLSPQLATLAEQPPAGQWLYEVKFDGYRVMARVADGKVRLFTRNGHDWTEKMADQAKAIAALGLENSWLDGEMVVLNDEGLPDFQALQNAFETNRSQHIVYYLFDAPFLNGEDLRSRPLEERRERLEAALDAHDGDTLRFSAAFDADHRSIVDSACAMSLEGVIGKRAGSTYVSRRSQDWIKLKCRRRQEFIIVGFTKPQGSRAGFGALLLGVNDRQHGLIHAGRVGTGFSHAALKELHTTLQKIERKGSPLDKPVTSAQGRGVHWVKPQLVCEVEFAEWTRDGHIRHATFIALRSDKPPAQIVREEPQPIDAHGKEGKKREQRASKAGTADPRSGSSGGRKGREAVAGVSISNPDRVIDKQGGWTKKDLAEFYEDIADWVLPELDNRPVSLLRAPEGADGEQFFQKHAERLAIPNIKHLDKSLDPGHDRLMEINSIKALVGAVQMGAIELHTWGANSDRIETPDRFVLDLDPDPALPWRTMIEATQLTLSILDEIGLESWLKVSGGKGLHITVPLARHADWETVKHFSKSIAQFAARMLPERFTAVMGPKNRVGKIFIDYLRNQRGASIVTAYSVRARPGLPVSVPIHRDELADLRSAQQWHIGNLGERLNGLSHDPWEGYANRQRITKKMWQQLDAEPPSAK